MLSPAAEPAKNMVAQRVGTEPLPLRTNDYGLLPEVYCPLVFRIMAKGFLGKHNLDAGFGQLRDIIKFVCWKRGKFFAKVDHRGTSQTCPNCRTEVRKTLADRIHNCKTCGYQCDRDIASSQEICNRGIEKYCNQGIWGTETACQVEVAGAMSLANWHRESLWAGMSQGDLGSPTHNL